MGQSRYIQPKSCELNKTYYMKMGGNGTRVRYKKVRFLGYRPHPAEVLIHDGDRIRVIHRSILYLRKLDKGGYL